MLLILIGYLYKSKYLTLPYYTVFMLVEVQYLMHVHPPPAKHQLKDKFVPNAQQICKISSRINGSIMLWLSDDYERSHACTLLLEKYFYKYSKTGHHESKSILRPWQLVQALCYSKYWWWIFMKTVWVLGRILNPLAEKWMGYKPPPPPKKKKKWKVVTFMIEAFILTKAF